MSEKVEVAETTDKAEKIIPYISKALFIITSLIYIYFSAFGAVSEMTTRCLLVALLCPTIFLTIPLQVFGRKNTVTRVVDVLLAAYVAFACYYLMWVYPIRFIDRTTPATTMDIVIGAIFLVCVFEMTRRTTGKPIMIIAAIFLIYAKFGSYFPGFLKHAGVPWRRILSFLFTTTEGFFGTAMGIAASYIIMFCIFASFLEAFGTGEWFVDVAYAMTGRFRGGPAKTAVIASGLMGMINGNATSNVVTTGAFTIPLMKKVGYEPHIAGAVEAAASTGGLFTPPIMGAAAFIMADYIGVPYIEVAKAAAIPALLFYFSIIMSVDAIAIKSKLSGVNKDALPNIGNVMKERGFFMIPIVLLVGMILYGYSALKTAFFAIIAVLVVAFFRKETRPNLKRITNALAGGSSGAVSIVATCLSAGIIVGMVNLSGISQKLSYNLIQLANGNMYIAAVIIAILCIILGCGMPPAAVYILSATVLAPPMIEMGANIVATHLFIFMFSCLGAVTPPVAVTAYTAAALAKAEPAKTGYTAFRLAIIAFIVPFIFISSPALVMQGSVVEILIAAITALIGVLCLVGALEGYVFIKFPTTTRVIFGIAAILTIHPGQLTDVIGLALIAVGLVICFAARKREAKQIDS